MAKARARAIADAAFLQADVRCMPFAPGAFDGVLCFGVTQALDDSAPAVREIARVLAAGGELWIDGLNRWCVIHLYGSLRRRLRGRHRHLRYESPRSLLRLCRQGGLREVELYWLPVLPARSQRMQRFLESKAAVWLLRHVPFAGALVSHSFIVRARR